jgi:hypothetical protein
MRSVASAAGTFEAAVIVLPTPRLASGIPDMHESTRVVAVIGM